MSRRARCKPGSRTCNFPVRGKPCRRPSKHRSVNHCGIRTVYKIKAIPQAHEWNSRKIPEDNHEAPLFVEHIPCLWNTLFTFAASQNKVSRGGYFDINTTHHAFK